MSNEVEIIVSGEDKTAAAFASATARSKKFGAEIKANLAKAGQEAGTHLGEGIVRGADGRLRDAKGRFLKGLPSPAETERHGRSLGGRLVSGITGAISSYGGMLRDTLKAGFTNGLKGALTNPIVGPIVVSAVGGVAAVLAPALATMVSGAIIGGLGAGLVGMGAMALFHVEDIDKKWSKSEQKRVAESNKQAEKLRHQYLELGRDVINGLKAASQPLIPVLDTVRSTVRSVGKEFRPVIKQGLEIAKGPLERFTKNLGKAFKELTPAIKPVMTAFGDILDQIGPQLPGLFSQISDAITGMARTVSENKDLFGMIFMGLMEAIPATINLLSALAGAFRGVLVAALGFADGALGALQALMEAVAQIPGPWQDAATQMANSIQGTRDEINGLKTDVENFPKIVKLEGDIRDLDTKIAEARRQLKDPNLTKTRRAKLEAQIDQLLAAKRRAQAELNSLHDKTVRVTLETLRIERRSVQEAAPLGHVKRASGGIIGAAAGGPRGSVTLVGEQGPELVKLPFGSTVIPAGSTRSMLQSEREARKSAVSDLTISRFGRAAGAKHTEFETALGKPQDVKSLASALNGWRKAIKDATHGLTELRLLKDLDVAGKALIKNERLLTKVNSALEKAKDKLTELRDSFKSMRDSVASGIVSGGNITGISQDRAASVGGIIGGLGEKLTQARGFTSALAQLKKKGLNSGALADIAQAGVEGGGATAQALLGASASQIKLINSLQSQLKSTAKSAGTITADAMYGAGIKAAEGVVKGLEKNKDRIEKAMMHIATALEKAIRKALGVKKKASGGIIGAAGGGPRSALTLVGEQGPELVNLPFGSRVIPSGQSRSMLAGGGGGPIQVVLEVRGGGSSDMERMFMQMVRKYVRVNGGNVQTVLGKG